MPYDADLELSSAASLRVGEMPRQKHSDRVLRALSSQSK